MKRTLHTTLITTILLSLLFVSCNADASAGLFRQLADAKAPVGITYKQIIGKDGPHLYFLTDDGIYKSDGNITTTVRENKKGSPVYEAYLDTANDLIFYLVNDGSNAEIHQVDISGTGDIELVVTIAEDMNPGWKMKQLLANGLYVIKGTDTATTTDSFLLATYQSALAQYANKVLITGLSGYDRDAALQMSGRQQWGIGEYTASTTAPMILSFVTSNGLYKHFYTEGTIAATYELTLNKSLAGFWTNGTNLYLITRDGNLYGSTIPTGPTTPVLMKNLSREFPSTAFVYGISSGGTTYIITKTTTAAEAFFVVSFADNHLSTTVDTKMVSTGYASQMRNVNIVNAYEKATGNLLIATEKNGMFEISITDAATDTGTSKGPEDYSLL